jgi:hypothetical protein
MSTRFISKSLLLLAQHHPGGDPDLRQGLHRAQPLGSRGGWRAGERDGQLQTELIGPAVRCARLHLMGTKQ